VSADTNLEWRIDGLADSFAELGRRVIIQPSAQHGELGARDPGSEGIRPHHANQTPRDLDHECVPGAEAHRVVDGRGPVEIDEQYRGACSWFSAGFSQAEFQKAAGGQTG
jgi:hypothetical protein